MWNSIAPAMGDQSFRSKVVETVVGQFIALVAFFAFPIVQYISLKWFSRKEGQPQLWYLPRFGFRLVIRNLPRKKTLSAIKYRALLRKVVGSSAKSSVSTFDDRILIQKDDFFLFPGTDQVLLSFQLHGPSQSELEFVLTDKLGNRKESILLTDFDRLICDYTATLNNMFSFNVKLAKRAEISTESLRQIWIAIQEDNTEGPVEIDRVRSVT